MKAIIIVESWFGNTRAVADTVADSLRGQMVVEVFDVQNAPEVIGQDVTLLVLGGPTHAFGLSRASTRADAVKRGAPAAPGLGLRDWLSSAPTLVGRPWVAVFDTRIDKPLVPGSAAKAVVRKLRKVGGRLLLGPESFYVTDMAGPLKDGELKRAEDWAEDIVTALGRHGLVSESAG